MFKKLKQFFAPQTVESKDDVLIKIGEVEIKGSLQWQNVPPPQPLPPITLASPACPYCGVVQEPPPTRRKKCLDCNETIYTWTDKETRVKRLLTAKQHKQASRAARDAEWKALNMHSLEAMKDGDWQTLSFAQFRQAGMLFDRSADHHRMAQESRKSELRFHRSRGGTRVTVYNIGDKACSECRPQHGREYNIDDAMREMPIPVKLCKFQADKNPHGGWCRCSYMPVGDQ